MENPVSKKKPTTNDGQKKLDPVVVEMIMQTRGMLKRIARAARISKFYASNIVHGRRRPTEKFIRAAQGACLEQAQRMNMAAFMARYGGQK